MDEWRNKGKPKLYVATMDIRKCYDSVNIDNLMSMIKYEDFFEEMYIIHQFIKVIRSKRYLFSKNLSKISKKKLNGYSKEWIKEKIDKFEKRGKSTKKFRKSSKRKIHQTILHNEEKRNFNQIRRYIRF